mmetsp:Transcript_4594/g.9268  ORF Transcript_4594/g.9268 Transcript_4594/m.9268 type:complete len:123 (-) Transcript_4594:205-573(-)|eukprot:scaffold267_cov192-Amphora_coffeaeformis.AAC.17
MSWFGGGSKEEPAEKSFDMGESGHDMPMQSVSGGGGGGGLGDMQQFGMALQQQVLIQQAITDMSDRAFVKCITGSIKDGHLTGKEVACIQAATNKWLDTNELLMGRLARKSQQAAQGQGGFH